MSKVKKAENMENVLSMYEMFDHVNYEEDLSSIIPFAKSKSDILIIAGLDDKLGPSSRQVSFNCQGHNLYKHLNHVFKFQTSYEFYNFQLIFRLHLQNVSLNEKTNLTVK